MRNYSRNLKILGKILFIIKTLPKGVLLDIYRLISKPEGISFLIRFLASKSELLTLHSLILLLENCVYYRTIVTANYLFHVDLDLRKV